MQLPNSSAPLIHHLAMDGYGKRVGDLFPARLFVTDISSPPQSSRSHLLLVAAAARRWSVPSTSVFALSWRQVSSLQALEKIDQTGVTKAAIDVVFDHVKGKIVRATATPNSDRQKKRSAPLGMLQQQQCTGQKTGSQHQTSLQIKQPRILQIGHPRSAPGNRTSGIARSSLAGHLNSNSWSTMPLSSLEHGPVGIAKTPASLETSEFETKAQSRIPRSSLPPWWKTKIRFCIVATIARWWTNCMVDVRCHPPRGRGGYEEMPALSP